MVVIYVLRCTSNKYYVGKSDTILERITDHFHTNGSAWTKKYKPLDVEKIMSDCDDYDEDKWTLKYMEIYGIDNVRGGSFCRVKLSDDELNIINKMINGSSNKCYNCGNDGHFIGECPNLNKKINITKIINTVPYCELCGRDGHHGNDCYAKTDIHGNYLIDISDDYDDVYYECWCCEYCGKEFDTKKGATCHENLYCKKKNQVKRNTKKNTSYKKLSNSCYRCGRDGHYADTCYAKKTCKRLLY